MIVEIDFGKLKRICRYHATVECNSTYMDVCSGRKSTEGVLILDEWTYCNIISCPYCELKDEDDGK